MHITISQRQATMFVMALQAGGALLTAILLLGGGDSTTLFGAVGAAVVFSMLLVAYWRGWELARYAFVVVITALVALATPEPYLSQQIAYSTLLPSVVALILAEPIWVIGSALVILTSFLIRSGGQGVYANPINLVVDVMFIGGMILARFVADTALRSDRENAGRLAEALAHMRHQTQELAEANDLMSGQLDEQGKLLELVTTLETPVVPLATGMLLAPVVGHLDARRAEFLTNRLLQEANTQRARLVVLDIAGVTMVDTAVARALIQTVQALRLLGCDVVLSGISASVAMALIHLGVDLEKIHTVRSPQEALAYYLGGAKRATPASAPAQITRGSATSIDLNGHGAKN
jgi:rsbT co-antagonist protein RsbR